MDSTLSSTKLNDESCLLFVHISIPSIHYNNFALVVKITKLTARVKKFTSYSTSIVSYLARPLKEISLLFASSTI